MKKHQISLKNRWEAHTRDKKPPVLFPKQVISLGGDKRDRTADRLNGIQALSQAK